MNWEVTHSCGHIETHLIVVQFAYLGETRARQLKRRKCTACYRAGKQAEATDQAKADDAVLAGIDLPALVGSEKQVDWAGKIRRERLAAALRKDPDLARYFVEQTDARWWIDNRNADFAAITLAR
jgi:hypothetical protein